MKKMKLLSIIIILSMIGFGSLQYMETNPPDLIMDPEDIQHFQLPLDSNDYQERGHSDLKYATNKKPQREKRTPEEYIDSSNEDWPSNVVDDPIVKKEGYVDVISLMDSLAQFDVNGTELTKRSFSPWGGKRNHDNPIVRRLMWTLKQADSQEPSKRVRFSPWGGKRSDNHAKHIQDPDLIYPAAVYPKRNEPTSDEVHENPFSEWRMKTPLRILGLHSNQEEQYHSPTDYILEKKPVNYFPPRPFVEMYLKKDGKRKVKFSAWGGKRAMSIPSDLSSAENFLNHKNRLHYEINPYHAT